MTRREWIVAGLALAGLLAAFTFFSGLATLLALDLIGGLPWPF